MHFNIFSILILSHATASPTTEDEYCMGLNVTVPPSVIALARPRFRPKQPKTVAKCSKFCKRNRNCNYFTFQKAEYSSGYNPPMCTLYNTIDKLEAKTDLAKLSTFGLKKPGPTTQH